MDQVAQIRERIDIVQLISEYIALKKTGANFKANCPFHGEKTPSFVVSPTRQIWHCFGCQKGGDIYSFLMEYEHIEFIEALRMLARQTGIELQNSSFQNQTFSQKEKLYRVNKTAMDFYHFVLTEHPAGKKALHYLLTNRGLNEGLIKTFMIGFAPGVGYALSRHLVGKKKYNPQDLIDGGLSLKKQGGLFDFFSNRIMFPLIDHRDNVVGFSGRIIDDPTNNPGQMYQSSKYVNTKETLVYHKGSHFFGINIARDEIKKEDRAIVVEGEFDVIACFRNGIKNSIALKGTALTEAQALLLTRITSKVSLCFDQDSAGQQALRRSIPVLEKKGLTPAVIVLSGKDPDDAFSQNEIGFKQAIKHDVSAYDYLLAQSTASHSQTIDGKKEISDELLPFFIGIQNEIVKEHYFKKLAEVLDTSVESVTKQAEKLTQPQIQKPIAEKQKEKKLRKTALEEYLLALLFQADNPKEQLLKISDHLLSSYFNVASFAKLYESFLQFSKAQPEFSNNAFTSSLPAELLDAYNICFLFPKPEFGNDTQYEDEIQKTAQELKTLFLKAEMQQMSALIKQKEKSGESEELEKLQEDFSKLVAQLKS